MANAFAYLLHYMWGESVCPPVGKKVSVPSTHHRRHRANQTSQ